MGADTNKIYKLKSYKKLNKEATLFGYPFGIFFVVMMWTAISVLIIISAPYILKIVWAVLFFLGIGGVNYIYKKVGMKLFLKRYDMLFKKMEVVKNNENVIIPKKKLLNE